jgi:hypothetical protein
MDDNTSSSSTNRKDKFTESIEEMMFGFGSEWPPDAGAVSLVENIAVNYMRDITLRAKDVASIAGKLDKECFVYVVNKDQTKFNRIDSLLKANEEINQCKKFDTSIYEDAKTNP